MTGRHFDGTPGRIEQRQQELDKLLKEHFASEPDTAEPSAPPCHDLSDIALIEKALSAKNAPDFGSFGPAIRRSMTVITAGPMPPFAGCWHSGPEETLSASTGSLGSQA